MPYLDLHCDTLGLGFMKKKEDIYELPEAMLDIQRMKAAGMFGQFFAMFFPPVGREGMPEDEIYYQSLLKLFRNSLEKSTDCIAFAGSGTEAEKNFREGRLSAFLTIEDGRHAQGRLENIERFYEDGVRLISLTWNQENCFGAPNSRERSIMEKGLTSFGKEAVRYMNGLGMIIDVSHLSDRGFYDVLELTKKPFVASHSNARSLSPHPRNLTDEMIRGLAEKGGIAGVNFYGAFLNADAVSEKSTLEALTAHIAYMSKLGGEDFVALGTDFDGIRGEIEINSPLLMERLFEELGRKGFSQSQIEKLAYKNALRVIHEVTD
ncbi:MAG: dipeptidase [Lachnospiraceae bacterium]|nr:dipeptidase [Lachnospiraceae bacterium]